MSKFFEHKQNRACAFFYKLKRRL